MNPEQHRTLVQIKGIIATQVERLQAHKEFDSREKSIAVTHIETGTLWLDKLIANAPVLPDPE